KSGKGRVEFTGFDMQPPTVALENVRDFVAKTDPDYVAELANASQLAKSAQQMTNRSNFAFATGRFPIQDAAGKRVRFSGYIKTENVTRGSAHLWWRVDGPSGVLAVQNLKDQGVTGPTAGQRCGIA